MVYPTCANCGGIPSHDGGPIIHNLDCNHVTLVPERHLPIVDQPTPTKERAEMPAVWDLVIADMRERDHVGRARYGTPLQPNNGRDALVDCYQEILDAAVYLRQVIEERRMREGAGAVELADEAVECIFDNKLTREEARKYLADLLLDADGS